MINGYTKYMKRCSPFRYVSISPGSVATDMIKNAPWYKDKNAFDRIPLKRFAEPDEIGELAVLVADHEGPFQSGENIVFDGGFISTTRGGAQHG